MRNENTTSTLKAARTSRAKRRHARHAVNGSGQILVRQMVEARPPAAASISAPRSHLPSRYGKALGQIKERTYQQYRHAMMLTNSVMLMLHWEIGRILLERQAMGGWDLNAVKNLSKDLRKQFPAMRAFHPRISNICAPSQLHGAWELVALANMRGGKILLGVRDNGSVSGIKDSNALRARIQDVARNCDPSLLIRVEPRAWKPGADV